MEYLIQQWRGLFTALILLATVIAKVLGIVLIAGGMRSFVSNMNSQINNERFLIPTSMVFVGVTLIYVNAASLITRETVFGTPAILTYSGSQSNEWQPLAEAVLMASYFVGWVAFIRGIYMWRHLFNRASSGAFGPGLVFVLAGTAAMNLYAVVTLLSKLVGLPLPT